MPGSGTAKKSALPSMTIVPVSKRGAHSDANPMGRSAPGSARSDLGDDVEAAHPKGLGLPPIHVGNLPVVDLDVVDLQGINLLEGLLPAMLGHGCGVLGLRFGLCSIDIDLRTIELEVCHHPPE